jgi:hypothetical protein
MTWDTSSLVYNGESEGRGTTTACPGRRDFARSLVAVSREGPAAAKIAAFTPPPPGFNRLQGIILLILFMCK